MPLRHTFPFVFLALASASVALGPPWPYFVPLVLLACFLGFDAIFGTSVPGAGSPLLHRLLLWLYIPLQLAVMGFAACHAQEGVIAPALATGTVAGIFGMLTAHELIHSRRAWERRLGLAMLIVLGYGHFQVSHLQGHHRLAATPDDAATARRGESAYRFIARSIAGQWRFAWSRAPRRVLFYAASSGGIELLAFLLLGRSAVAYLLLTSLVAILILELFNYVAHYGLERESVEGRTQPLSTSHSWNTARRFNNWALFNGGRHSHHHAAPALAYEELTALEGSPELPFGYGGAIVMALVPPLWKRVMDARIDRYRQAASA